MKYNPLLPADIPEARSSEEVVAQATRHKRTSLERKKRCSSEQCEASGLQPRSMLERKSARLSEETQNIVLARSSE